MGGAPPAVQQEGPVTDLPCAAVRDDTCARPARLWQVVHLVGMVGLGGWLPGIGLIVTFGGGVGVARAALELASIGD